MKPIPGNAERLTEFLSQLTPSAAAKLACGLEQERLRGTEGLPYELILNSIRPILRKIKGPRWGAPDAMRQFSLPFEDLLVNRHDLSQRRRQISRASIETVWAWLNRDLLPGELPKIADRITKLTLAGDHASLGREVELMHSTCAAAILGVLDKSRDHAARRAKLERLLGGESAFDDALHIGEMLSIAPFMLKLYDGLPGQIEDFDDHLVALVCGIFEDVREIAQSAAIYVPLATMNRLADPRQILRLVRKASGLTDDSALDRAGLDELGEVFVGELEDIAAKLAKSRPGQTDLDEMQVLIDRFAVISQGFIREIDIRRGSVWGRRILTARATLATTISDEIVRFEAELTKSLPVSLIGSYSKNGPRRADASRAPDFVRAEKVSACLRFLRGVSRVAESIGVQTQCKTAQQHIDAYLLAYEGGLLDGLHRTRGPELANSRAYLDLVITFHEMKGDAAAAETLRRRGKNAAAQAS